MLEYGSKRMRVRLRNPNAYIIPVIGGYYHTTPIGELIGPFDTREEAIEELRKYVSNQSTD
jgi:hypothetical protein